MARIPWDFTEVPTFWEGTSGLEVSFMPIDWEPGHTHRVTVTAHMGEPEVVLSYFLPEGTAPDVRAATSAVERCQRMSLDYYGHDLEVSRIYLMQKERKDAQDIQHPRQAGQG